MMYGKGEELHVAILALTERVKVLKGDYLVSITFLSSFKVISSNTFNRKLPRPSS
jgi:hypothetical protein